MTGIIALQKVEIKRGLLSKTRVPVPARWADRFERWLTDKVERWFPIGRAIDGLRVGSTESEPQPGLRRVERALRLIRVCDPVNYSRVLRHLDRVWVRLIPSARAQYERQLNACVLDERFVLSETIQEIASAIVHETTHARLEHWGIAYDEKVRSRIEAICIRRQLNFVGKLPGGEALRKGLVSSLQWYGGNQDYFSDARSHERHWQGVVETAKHLGASAWLVRLISKFGELLLAQRAASSK